MILRTLMVGLASLFLLFPATKTSGYQASEISNQVGETYRLGSAVSFADKEISSQGLTAMASSVLVYPNGVSYGGPDYSLNVEGQYHLFYRGMNNGVLLSEEHVFSVYSDLVTFSSTSSYASLVDGGVKLTFKEETKATFATILDLAGVGANDSLVSVRVNPSSKGSKDFSKLRFSFSEVSDPTNVLSILVQASPYSSSTAYALAGGKNQQLTGYEADHDRIHVNNQFGAPFPFSFSGDSNVDAMTVSFDAQKLIPYVGAGKPIIDLSSDAYFKKPWKGFPTNKVKFSLSPENLLNSEASLTVTSLRGADLTSLDNKDLSAPGISVQYGGNDSAPKALLNHTYPVFQALGNDAVNGKTPVFSEVFFNYGKSNQCSIDSIDGVFTPKELGIYTIVYSSLDYSGNQGRKVVEVTCVASLEEVTINLVSSTKITKGLVGERVTLATALTHGGTGKVNLVSQVTLLGKEIVRNQDSFLLQSAGVYDVVFEATDYIGRKATSSYNITASKSPNPVFASSPSLPNILLNEESYALPTLSATDYSGSTPTEIVSSVSFFDGNKETPMADGCVKISTSENEGVIRYRAGNAVLDIRKPVVHARDENGIHMEKYFYGVAALANSDSISLPVGASSFANKLLAEGFALKFSSRPEKSDFSALKIILEDSENANERLTISFVPEGSNCRVELAGTSWVIPSGFRSDSPSNDFSLSLIDTFLMVGDIKTKISSFDNGQPFSGFSSSFVNLSICGENASDSLILVKSINGQPLSSSLKDAIKPKIKIFGDYGGDKKLGSVALAARAIAADVLDPNVTLQMTVTKPDGKTPAVSASGSPLTGVRPNEENYFPLDQYGSWKVDYSASDSHNGSIVHSIYSYKVNDDVKPTISVDTRDIVLREGEFLPIPKAEVSDNLSPKENLILCLFLVSESGNPTPISEQDQIPMTKGHYILRYLAYDEAGNMALVDVKVEVSA